MSATATAAPSASSTTVPAAAAAATTALASGSSGKWRNEDCQALISYWVTHTSEWSQKPKSQFYNAVQHAIFPDRSVKSIKNKCEFLERTYRNMANKMRKQGFDHVELFPPKIEQRVRKEYKWFYEMHEIVTIIELSAKPNGSASAQVRALAAAAPVSASVPAPTPGHNQTICAPAQVQLQSTMARSAKTKAPTNQLATSTTDSTPTSRSSTPASSLATNSPAQSMARPGQVAKDSPLKKVTSKRTPKTSSPRLSPTPAPTVSKLLSSQTHAGLALTGTVSSSQIVPMVITPEKRTAKNLHSPLEDACLYHSSAPQDSNPVSQVHRIPTTPEENTTSQESSPIPKKKKAAHVNRNSKKSDKKRNSYEKENRMSSDSSMRPDYQNKLTQQPSNPQLDITQLSRSPSQKCGISQSSQQLHQRSSHSKPQTSTRFTDLTNCENAMEATFRVMRPLRIVTDKNSKKQNLQKAVSTTSQQLAGDLKEIPPPTSGENRTSVPMLRGNVNCQSQQVAEGSIPQQQTSESASVVLTSCKVSNQLVYPHLEPNIKPTQHNPTKEDSKRTQDRVESENPTKRPRLPPGDLEKSDLKKMTQASSSVRLAGTSEVSWLQPLLDLGNRFIELEARKLELMEQRLEFDRQYHRGKSCQSNHHKNPSQP